MNRAPFLIGGLIVLLQVSLLGYGLARADNATQLRTPIRPTTDVTLPLALETIMPFAGGVAADWRADSRLVGASMQIDWPHERGTQAALDLPPGGWIFLAFLSENDLLTMRIDRASGVIVQTSLISLGDRARSGYADRAIDLVESTTSSSTAALAAETAHGTAFRNACPDQRFLSWLTARKSADGRVDWHIEYPSVADEPQPPLEMDIDWQSGQIQNVANASAPCV